MEILVLRIGCHWAGALAEAPAAMLDVPPGIQNDQLELNVPEENIEIVTADFNKKNKKKTIKK